MVKYLFRCCSGSNFGNVQGERPVQARPQSGHDIAPPLPALSLITTKVLVGDSDPCPSFAYPRGGFFMVFPPQQLTPGLGLPFCVCGPASVSPGSRRCQGWIWSSLTMGRMSQCSVQQLQLKPMETALLTLPLRTTEAAQSPWKPAHVAQVPTCSSSELSSFGNMVLWLYGPWHLQEAMLF